MMDEQAASSLIGVVLMIAVVVVLGGVVAGFGLGYAEKLTDPAPNVAESSGEITVQDGFDGGIVRIEHQAGDTVAVSDIEIAVDASRSCGEQARIINLPAERNSPTFIPFSDDNLLRGDDSFISKGSSQQEWDAGALHIDNGGSFSAGTFFEFRIASSECSLSPGDRVDVRVLYTPSDLIIIEENLVVTE